MAEEFVARPPEGRVYRTTRRVHLGDVGSNAKLRLEALARYLQDVATDDADDSGLDQYKGVWVVRKLAVEVRSLPRYHDQVELATFCSGVGPCWAERRTTMTAGDRVLAEAAAVWVYIERAGGRPQPLEPDFFEIYGSAAQDRRVSSRLRHRRPEAGAASRPWPLRDSDFDVLDHVNNARYFEAVEDELATRMPGLVVGRAEMEFRGAVERGVAVDLVSDAQPSFGSSGAGSAEAPARLAAWLMADGEVRASALVTARARA